MRRAIPRFSNLALPLGITGLFAIGCPAEVRAQTIFCPATFSGSPVALVNGSCTDRIDGAFSGAAVASQALSELSQTTTQVTTKEIGKAVVERREQERERCPAGFSRVNGACQPRRRPVSEPARAVPPEKPKPAAVTRREPPPPPALLPLPIEPAVRFGTWTQVYGDYQTRDAAGPSALTCCIGGPLPQPTLALNIQSRASTVGFVAGADFSSGGLFSAIDGFIGGVTAGYTWSELKLNTSATSIDQPLVGTGVSRLRAIASWPTAGLYATYFNAGVSSGVPVQFWFLSLRLT